MKKIIQRTMPKRWYWQLATLLVVCVVMAGCQSAPRISSRTTISPPALPISPSSLPASSPNISNATALPNTTTPASDEAYRGGINTHFDSVAGQHRYAPSQDKMSSVYNVTPGEALQGELGLWSTFPDTKHVTLILLLNYQQAQFRLNDQPVADSIDLDLISDQQQKYQFSTQPLVKGYYDFAIVIMVDPYNTAMDTRTRIRTTFTPVIRGSVFVGDVKPPTMQFEPFQNTEKVGERFSDLCFITEQSNGLNQWPGQQVAPGEKLSLFVRTVPLKGNVRPDAAAQTVPVALVAFMDNHVVPIGDQPAVYGLTQHGEISTLPITITAPNQVGKHQFFVHQFPNPFVETITTSQGEQSFYSLSTQRIVLDVKQP